MTEKLQADLESFRFCFPIMQRLADFLAVAENNHLRGKRIGWHCHLTSITTATVEVMVAAGAQLHLSECNPDTSDDAAVEYMRRLGARVHTGEKSIDKVLAAEPVLTSDTGLALTEAALARGIKGLYAGSEITTSGITRLRALQAVPIPIININDGQLKAYIENFHGVGDGVIDALFKLTGRLWSGRPAAVLGYGRVGAGVASYLRKAGAVVSVVEVDPVRRLIAHYDGFTICDLPAALSASELIVTATGQQSVIPDPAWAAARNGQIVFNVGHFSQEIDSLKRVAKEVTPFAEHMERVRLAHADVFLVAHGSPANVAMLTGSPEPTLIHLTAEMLCLNYLAHSMERKDKLAPGEQPIPPSVEQQASLLALSALQPQKA